MPLEELLAIYRYEASAGSSIDSSSGDLTDELPDMTLDKVHNNSYMAALHRKWLVAIDIDHIVCTVVLNIYKFSLSRRK